MKMMQTWTVIVVAALAFAANADARCRGSAFEMVSEAPPSRSVAEDAAFDRTGRIVASLMVNGRGPYRFIVDTGANRSAVSRELAAELGLIEQGTSAVHTVHDMTMAPLARVDSIAYGGLTFPGGSVPVLERQVLAGEDGLLGVDGMAGRTLVLDLDNRCIEIAESQRGRALRRWARLPGTLRFGHLVLVQGEVNRQSINVLIDTGSSTTLANTAFQNLLSPRATIASFDRPALLWTASGSIEVNAAVIAPNVEMGDVTAENVLAFVGDFHIFDFWGLREQPTLLVGMDVIERLRGIAIDYENGDVYFRLRDEPGFNLSVGPGR